MKVLFFTKDKYFYNNYVFNSSNYLELQSYEFYKSEEFSNYYHKKYCRIFGSEAYRTKNFLDFDLIIFESIQDSLDRKKIEELQQYVFDGGNIIFLLGSFNNCSEILNIIDIFDDVTVNNDIVLKDNNFSPLIKISAIYDDIVFDNEIEYINGCTFEIKKDADFNILQEENTQRLINPRFDVNNKIIGEYISNEKKHILVYKKHGKGSVLYWGSKDFIFKEKYEHLKNEYDFFCNLILIFFKNYINKKIKIVKENSAIKEFNILYNNNEKFEYNNLAYFASGSYKKHYKYLKFKNIYLIDYYSFSPNKYGIINRDLLDDYYSFDTGLNKRIKIKKNENNTVYLMDMNVFEAVYYFRQNNIKLDCVVNINEGLYEGGGKYSLKTHQFLGYLMPILKREFLYIVEYPHLFKENEKLIEGKRFRRKFRKFFNYGYSKILLEKNDSRYLDPYIFSDYQWCYKKTVNVFVEKNKPKLIKIKLKNNKINFYLLNDSIWNYQNDLDFIITTYNYIFDDFLQTYYIMHNVINVSSNDYAKYYKILSLLKLFNEKKIYRIGLMPPRFYNIEVLVNMLNDNDFNYPKEIILFHLDKNDYKEFIKNNKEISAV